MAAVLDLSQAYGAYPPAGLLHLVLPTTETVLVRPSPCPVRTHTYPTPDLPLRRRCRDRQRLLPRPRPPSRLLAGLSRHDPHYPIHFVRRRRFSYENRVFTPYLPIFC